MIREFVTAQFLCFQSQCAQHAGKLFGFFFHLWRMYQTREVDFEDIVKKHFNVNKHEQQARQNVLQTSPYQHSDSLPRILFHITFFPPSNTIPSKLTDSYRNWLAASFITLNFCSTSEQNTKTVQTQTRVFSDKHSYEVKLSTTNSTSV